MNIVTIDFDIIMEPSIELYNELINENDPISKKINLCSTNIYLPANLIIYEKLTNFILKCIRNKVPIQFIQKHDEVYTKSQNDIQTNELITLYNIDHHHDITYHDDDFNHDNFSLNLGNWVLAMW